MIYAVVAVHDRKQFTRQFIEALHTQTINDTIQLVIVDDGLAHGLAGGDLQQLVPAANGAVAAAVLAGC
jgi:hypothetical protein